MDMRVLKWLRGLAAALFLAAALCACGGGAPANAGRR